MQMRMFIFQNVEMYIVVCILGTVLDERGWSLLSVGAIPEIFWGAVEFVSLL